MFPPHPVWTVAVVNVTDGGHGRLSWGAGGAADSINLHPFFSFSEGPAVSFKHRHRKREVSTQEH